MLPEDQINFLLAHFKELEAADLRGLPELAQERTLAAGEVWLPPGEVTRKLAYIRRGLIRSWRIGENDEEATLLLRWEDQFVAPLESLLGAKPSRYTFTAIEETTLIELKDEAWAMIDRNPRLSALRGQVLLLMLGQAMDRVESFVLLSPEERYRKLVAEKPDIVNRVPDKYLSTYLGVTPVSLSRIRRRMARR
jgi:CRP-like cAMP-binding protein